MMSETHSELETGDEGKRLMTDGGSDGFVVTQRNVDGQRVGVGKWMVNVIGMDFENGTDTYVPRKGLGSYGFKRVTEDMADHIHGEIPETEGIPVIHVGSDFGKNYWDSHDSETIPVDVLEWMVAKGLTLIRGADGGWESWDGRPEFSETQMDLTDCEVVDMEAEIESRRD